MPKAVRYDQFGGIDVLRVEEVERPVPADGQVCEAYTELERRHTRGKIVLRP
jgi:hypothetical protein